MTTPYETGTVRRILIADDDIDDQEILGEALEKLQPAAEVTMVSNGLKVVKNLEACTDEALPQLIILDYNMPELNGEQVLQVLSEKPRYARIYKVVLSTSSSPYYKSACRALGAHGYHTKPSSFTDFEALVDALLRSCAHHLL